MTKEIVFSSNLIVKKLIQKDANSSEIFQSIIRACPVARNIKSEVVKAEALDLMKSLIVYLIPRGSELCKQLLSKHFGKCSLEILLEVSENCPEALHLAVCIAANCDSPNSFLQTYPYIILNMGREAVYRNAAIVAIDQYLIKQLPKVEIDIEIGESQEFQPFEEYFQLIRKFFKRLLKYKAGISQDQNYISHAIAKVMIPELLNLVDIGLKFIKYERARYMQIHQNIKDDRLTDMLLASSLSVDELLVAITRLQYYKS